MQWTKRAQNICKDCSYTWYPRGKYLSIKCPNCGSRSVALAPFGWVAFGLVLLFTFFVRTRAFHSIGNPTKEVIAASPAAGLPATPLKAPPRTPITDEAQREAIRRFPALGVAGSAMNAEFVSRYNQYLTSRPDFFKDSLWPIRLAEEADQTLREK